MTNKSPTGTGRIEKAWHGEISKRWLAFKKSTVSRFRDMNKEGQITNETFVMSAEQIRVYMVFLESEIDRLLLVTESAPNWQAQYQLQAYERGLETTRQSLLSQGASLAPTAEEIAAGAELSPFTSIPSIGRATEAPIHSDALAFLFQRSYTSLNGWTDALARETRQILFDGVQQGRGIDETVRLMVKRQNVSRSRARVIAQTETTQAYQQSSTNETQRASEEIGEEILMRWITVMDPKVRHLHASWHGTTVTPEKNRLRIGQSPWNCRCAQIPVIPEADTSKKRAKFKKEREKLLLLERR